MSNQVKKVFKKVETNARGIYDYWWYLQQELSQRLPDSYYPELQDLTNKLKQALDNLVNELDSPTLTLATTGTTSSGKSTLVNFLCGAELVPVAVQEMSAGIVIIEYSENISLEIYATVGAAWESGKWENITEEEIYKRLNDIMKGYHNNKDQNPNMACPQSRITYPFRMVRDLNLELPEATKIRIMDLPGLAFVGDEGNANVIRQCREALCLVTYNSEETDRKKMNDLLQEVVEQVKELRGTPARMLFVLNKIDVFHRDKDWKASEEDFITKTVTAIKAKLTEELREHTEDINNLQVEKLSTYPALLALQIEASAARVSYQELLEELPSNQDKWSAMDRKRFNHANQGLKACREAYKFFNFLIDENILEDLPGKKENWLKQDRIRVAQSLWANSYAENFETTLKDHINDKFPQLVIPQIIARFNNTAADAVKEWAVQTTNAILNSSRERYEMECAEIARIKEQLNTTIEEADKILRGHFEKLQKGIKKIKSSDVINDEIDPIVIIEQEIQSIQNSPYYNRLGEKLYPLYGWRRSVYKAIVGVLESVAKSFSDGEVNLDHINLKSADERHVTNLDRNLRRIICFGYTSSVAKQGEKRQAKTDLEKENLKTLNDEFNQLSNNLSLVLENICDKIYQQEQERMHDALEELFKCHLENIEKNAKLIAPKMEIKFPQSQLIKIQAQPKPKFKFQAGFPITSGTYQYREETLKTGDGKDQTKIEIGNSLARNTKNKSGWDWLGGAAKGLFKDFFWEGTVQNKRYLDFQPRTCDNAEIPKAADLLVGWLSQIKTPEREIAGEVLDWLLKEIENLSKNIEETQTDIIQRYQQRLDRAYQEIQISYEDARNIWEPMLVKAEELRDQCDKLVLENCLVED
jgi:GTPase SAR1 family protein